MTPSEKRTRCFQALIAKREKEREITTREQRKDVDRPTVVTQVCKMDVKLYRTKV